MVTDVWSSMGHESEEATVGLFLSRIRSMKLCSIWPTPAHCSCTACPPTAVKVGETLLDDPRSVVFHEAGNRLPVKSLSGVFTAGPSGLTCGKGLSDGLFVSFEQPLPLLPRHCWRIVLTQLP